MPDDARDLRQHQFVILDYALLDKMPEVGAGGVALYALLAKHAKYDTKECYPSLSRLTKLSGLARVTVLKYLDILEIHGFIRREKQQDDENGSLTNTHYFLLPSTSCTPSTEFKLGSTEFVLPLVQNLNYPSLKNEPELDPYNQIQKKEYYSSSNTRSELCKHSPPSPQQEYLDDAIASMGEHRQDTDEHLAHTLGKVIDSQHILDPATDPKILKKPRKQITPINDEEWPGLRESLADFDLPVEALDDNEFWNAVSYTAPNVYESSWLKAELAKIWQYFDANPSKRPRSQWKRFVSGWLTRAHEYQRRQEHAPRKQVHANGGRPYRSQQR